MSRRVCCAIYTRKSSEEGLEQAFNSLAAQREACEAYIQSQRAEGWRVNSERYDDGGISGATLERPALKRLLKDIDAGRVDTVVVYKVDRLTRTLSDFARLVEVFDVHEVSFVSVTQQFNTTTSMGRLTLNVLLSFAQFEREVTGERIRDKIAASKKKGLWMGGTAPLGYSVQDRELVIDPIEAQTIRKLYRLYLKHGSVREVVVAAKSQGLKTRRGNDISKGGLYVLLQNPIYVGRVRHKKETYPGCHAPIVDREIWDTAQERLAAQRTLQKHRLVAREPSLLAGKLYGPRGQRLTPTHASKSGRRYRYYVETDTETSKRPQDRALRIAANDIESLVVSALQNLLTTESELISEVNLDEICPEEMQALVDQGRALARECDDPKGCHVLVRGLVDRVGIGDETVTIRLTRSALLDALNWPAGGSHSDCVELAVDANLRRLGRQLRFIVNAANAIEARQPDSSLVKALLQGRRWWRLWLEGSRRTLKEIAEEEGVTDCYVRRLLPLALLAPDIVEMIIDGRQPQTLTTERLTKCAKLPIDWDDQRRLLIDVPALTQKRTTKIAN